MRLLTLESGIKILERDYWYDCWWHIIEIKVYKDSVDEIIHTM